MDCREHVFSRACHRSLGFPSSNDWLVALCFSYILALYCSFPLRLAFVVYLDIKMNDNIVFCRQDWGAIVLIDERFNKSPKYTNGKNMLCESER